MATGNSFYDLDLFAGTGVLEKVPNVDDAIGADVGALEAGVMSLYGVIVILGWVRVGCAVDLLLLLMERRLLSRVAGE